ncbi:MAG: hypothetical protein GF383_00535 [Candidatus Lokiarchaeota archaeon]|nr:hypothetical protein [Candidatus Lokiarchaeota archaeon]MBD3337645.1 hypothetical protein [Candidatus Lokiarchaeota archaeon]
MKNIDNKSIESCPHKNVKKDGPYLVCQDCGVVLEETFDFEDNKPFSSIYNDDQYNYERNIKLRDSKAKRDPKVKQKYDKIMVLERWFRDYETSFTEQKRTIQMLKGYNIKIDDAKYMSIKKRYLKYNRKHRKSYQNMVIIFLAIVWMEIKNTTNIRVERFIEICEILGHKISKKMLASAMHKVRKTETYWNKIKSVRELEKQIKERIKIVFQKDLNNASYEEVEEYIPTEESFEKMKIEMQLSLDRLLKKISYNDLQNLNYKAFTAGLLYYVGQTISNRKIFTQNLVEEMSKFSSTTIRKKYHILIDILGEPSEQPKIKIS